MRQFFNVKCELNSLVYIRVCVCVKCLVTLYYKNAIYVSGFLNSFSSERATIFAGISVADSGKIPANIPKKANIIFSDVTLHSYTQWRDASAEYYTDSLTRLRGIVLISRRLFAQKFFPDDDDGEIIPACESRRQSGIGRTDKEITSSRKQKRKQFMNTILNTPVCVRTERVASKKRGILTTEYSSL